MSRANTAFQSVASDFSLGSSQAERRSAMRCHVLRYNTCVLYAFRKRSGIADLTGLQDLSGLVQKEKKTIRRTS